MPGVHVRSIVTNDHACILIWDAHMHMGHNILAHTRMGYPICVRDVPYVRIWANIHIWGRTYIL